MAVEPCFLVMLAGLPAPETAEVVHTHELEMYMQ
jgi:hypothetical protein